jgi:hypothetical protein
MPRLGLGIHEFAAAWRSFHNRAQHVEHGVDRFAKGEAVGQQYGGVNVEAQRFASCRFRD